MSVFGTYSYYYNLYYRDKDYAAEAAYVDSLIRRYRPGASTLLNLGCGTGNHDFELVRFGYEIEGVDMSAEMLAVAENRLMAEPATIRFHQGDVRAVRLDRTFDAVVSLFHVMSYQTGNNDIMAAFATAREHLNPGGIFIFDFWHGPGVLTDPPVVRVRRLRAGDTEVVRLVEPEVKTDENVVEVNYNILVYDAVDRGLKDFREQHRMRYFFIPELVHFLGQQRFEPVHISRWLSDNPLDTGTWYGLIVARAL